MADTYDVMVQKVREIGVLDSVGGLLGWDQETYMPPNGLDTRAEQVAMLAELIHQRRTSPALGEVLAKLNTNETDPVRATNIRETRRGFERAAKIPMELVTRLARVTTRAKDAWMKARADSDFSQFAPHLKELIDLKRQEAEAIGYSEEPYDALLDEYEPGARASEVAAVFAALREPLAAFARTLTQSPHQPNPSILHAHFPRDAQERFSRRLAEAIGFDFKSGRIDVSTHPFCSGSTPGDVRLTTRYNEEFFSPSVFGVLHEAGHGLYEQGLNPSHMFTPMGAAVSLGIHESQSRLWENIVGRSRPFWEHFYPACQQAFPQSLAGVGLDDFVGAINYVAPSLIRVEADEVTYGLHIILRFELERDIIGGRLDVQDVPAAWNAKMQTLLGVKPSCDRDGCLQDIHWSMGAFGYFPTYALGNLYAAQFYQAAQKAIPDLADRIRRGDFGTLLAWLRVNIHGHGQRYRAAELVQVVTGKPLSIEPFMGYLREKMGPIYQLAN